MTTPITGRHLAADHPAAAAAPRRQLTVDNVQLTIIVNASLLVKIEWILIISSPVTVHCSL